MFEEQPPPPSTFDQSPWQKPDAVDASIALPPILESSPTVSERHDFVPTAATAAPPSEMSSSPYKSPVSASSNPIEQQVPWWLRESRKHLSPGSVRQSIALDSRIELGEPQDHHNNGSAGTGSEHAFTGTPSTPNLLHAATTAFSSATRRGPIHLNTKLSPKDRALWLWANVEDLDAFLQEVEQHYTRDTSVGLTECWQVYTFYVRKGMWSILLSSFLDLL
jgi:hypothetical protein